MEDIFYRPKKKQKVKFHRGDKRPGTHLFTLSYTKKMVKTLPALLVYYCNRKRDYWYLADDNISNSQQSVVLDFFKRIYNNCNK